MAEESLYKGGFPSLNDLKIRKEFLNANWQERYDLCKKFTDKRLSYFGWRLIYEEFPEALPANRKKEIHDKIKFQLWSLNKEKWNTLKDFNKDDYLLCTGDPAIIGITCSLASDITNGKYNLLKWDKQERTYYPIAINLHEKGEIDGN